MPVASPTATRRFSATSPDYEFAVPGFRPTGNTSHLFGRETTQFDATPTQLDLSDDDNDTPFVIAPAPQRPPPYQRAPIGDVQESIERAIEMLRARIEARKKTWPDGRPSRYYDDVPGVEESKGDRNYPDGDRPEPYGGDYEDESDDEDDERRRSDRPRMTAMALDRPRMTAMTMMTAMTRMTRMTVILTTSDVAQKWKPFGILV